VDTRTVMDNRCLVSDVNRTHVSRRSSEQPAAVTTKFSRPRPSAFRKLYSSDELTDV
jgi:hypothetical protein